MITLFESGSFPLTRKLKDIKLPFLIMDPFNFNSKGFIYTSPSIDSDNL